MITIVTRDKVFCNLEEASLLTGRGRHFYRHNIEEALQDGAFLIKGDFSSRMLFTRQQVMVNAAKPHIKAKPMRNAVLPRLQRLKGKVTG